VNPRTEIVMAFIKFKSGPQAGETIALNKARVVFGRLTSCDGVIAHPTVSREHFAIEKTGGKFLLVDQESGNGTMVNGERVSWVELKDGDKIQAGPFAMTFETMDDKERSSLPPDADNSEHNNSAHVASAQPVAFDAGHERTYPREYLKGIEDFNARRYFDAHEVWEEIWLRSTDDTKLFYQMLIQAAVGLHHYERDNLRGARGMYKNVVERLQRLPSFYMSLDLADFSGQFRNFFAGLFENEGEPSAPSADLQSADLHSDGLPIDGASFDRPRPFIRLLSSDGDD
jgi:uncharacterized protein